MASAFSPMGTLPSSPPYPADDSSPLPAPRNASSAALAALADTGIPLDTASGFHQWAMETWEAERGASAAAFLRSGIDELATAFELQSSAVDAIHEAYAPWLLGSAPDGLRRSRRWHNTRLPGTPIPSTPSPKQRPKRRRGGHKEGRRHLVQRTAAGRPSRAAATSSDDSPRETTPVPPPGLPAPLAAARYAAPDDVDMHPNGRPPTPPRQRTPERARQDPRHRLRELTRAWQEDRAAARRARAAQYAQRQRASFLEDLDVLPDGQRRAVVNRLASGPASPRAHSEEPHPQPSAAGDQPRAPVHAPSGVGGSRGNAPAPAPSPAPRNGGSGGPGPHGNPPSPPPAGRGSAQPQAPPPSNQPPTPFPEDALRDLLTWDMRSIMTANIPTVTRWPLQDDFALRATKADLLVSHANPQLHEAACRLVLLLPTLLLFPTKRSDHSIWRARIRLFDDGDWRALRDEALAWARRRSNTTPATSASRARRLVKCGELRRAANALTSGKVLPNNDDTLAKMRALHPAASFPLDPSPTLPPNNAPRTVFEPDDEHLLGALKTAPKGSAQGGTGWRYEHLRAIHNWRCKVPLPNFARLLVHSRVPPPPSAPSSRRPA